MKVAARCVLCSTPQLQAALSSIPSCMFQSMQSSHFMRQCSSQPAPQGSMCCGRWLLHWGFQWLGAFTAVHSSQLAATRGAEPLENDRSRSMIGSAV